MPLHPILTGHRAIRAVSDAVDRAQSAYEEAKAIHDERQANWEAEYTRALDECRSLPPPPESNVGALHQAANRASMTRSDRQRRAIRSHEQELRDALAARESELLALVEELARPLQRVALELQSLGHSMSHVDRATSGDLSKAATHQLGLDEVVAAATDGKSFLGIARMRGAEPSAARPLLRTDEASAAFNAGLHGVTP
jgi:hypothetical protein